MADGIAVLIALAILAVVGIRSFRRKKSRSAAADIAIGAMLPAVGLWLLSIWRERTRDQREGL